MQRLKQFDAVVSVVGAGHDNRAARGKEMRKWVYQAANSKMHLPYKGANPRFGIPPDHTAALLNGGAKIAMAISQGTFQKLNTLIFEMVQNVKKNRCLKNILI